MCHRFSGNEMLNGRYSLLVASLSLQLLVTELSSSSPEPYNYSLSRMLIYYKMVHTCLPSYIDLLTANGFSTALMCSRMIQHVHVSRTSMVAVHVYAVDLAPSQATSD